MKLGRMLDAAYPPAPAAWINDLNAAGAQVGAVYIPTYGGGGSGHYTSAHVQAAYAAGKSVMAVTLPGSAPPSIGAILSAAASIGIKPGPLAFDVAIGDNNFTNWNWLAQAGPAAEAQGWQPWYYLQPDIRGDAPPGLFWATAPVSGSPSSLPAGWEAWQYSGFTGPSGASYDISLIDLDQLPKQEKPMYPFLIGNDPGQGGNGDQELLLSPDLHVHVASGVDSGNLQNIAGLKLTWLSPTTFNAIMAILPGAGGGNGGLTAAQEAQLTDVQAKVDKDLA